MDKQQDWRALQQGNIKHEQIKAFRNSGADLAREVIYTQLVTQFYHVNAELNIALSLNQRLKQQIDKNRWFKTPSSNCETEYANLQKSRIQINQSPQSQLKNVDQKKTDKVKKPLSSQSQFVPSDYQNSNQKVHYIKLSETKNFPKMYSNLILNFMRKNPQILSKCLKYHGVDHDQFFKYLYTFKKPLTSISDLRGLWLESQNSYAKIFRVMTQIYLRKYCLQYIFNSRIQNYNVHIKFVKKLSDALKSPQSFTQLKDF